MRLAHVRTTGDADTGDGLVLCLRCGAGQSVFAGDRQSAAYTVRTFRAAHEGCTWEHDSDEDAVAAAERETLTPVEAAE